MRRRNCQAASLSIAATPGRSSILPAPCRWGWTVSHRGSSGGSTGSSFPRTATTLRQGEPAFAAIQSGKRIEFVSPVDGVVCAVNERINVDPAAARKEPYEKGWAFMLRPSNLSRDLKKLRIGADAAAWLEREARSFTEFLSLHRAVPVEVGATLPDGGMHVEGVMETMDGEILKIAIRKYFR